MERAVGRVRRGDEDIAVIRSRDRVGPKAVISTLTVIGVPALVVVPEVGATCNQAGAEENVRLNGSVPPWRLPLATRLNVIGAACVPTTVAGKTTEFALSPLIRALKVGW